MRYIITVIFVFTSLPGLLAQTMKRPDVPEPNIIKPPKVKSYRGSKEAGYMGLFDWNFSAGYIDKTASLASTTVSDYKQSSSGQYLMFHLQESVLSNYIWAKSYKRDKRVKIGLQNTFDLGFKRGSAISDSSNYATVTDAATDAGFFFNYQFGLAGVIKITNKIDVGYTFYPYVKSIFSPEVERYQKVRARVGHFMGEYSFGGKNCIELKYLRGKRLYIGASYTKGTLNFTNPGPGFNGSSNTTTTWWQVSLGRVF